LAPGQQLSPGVLKIPDGVDTDPIVPPKMIFTPTPGMSVMIGLPKRTTAPGSGETNENTRS
jgi:hypothetical protein